MPGQKRSLQDSATAHKSKKPKISDDAKVGKTAYEKSLQSASALVPEDVDFPRGGGTSFTPLEVKSIRAEAFKEANEELFHVSFFIKHHPTQLRFGLGRSASRKEAET